jgi:DinB superfamily
LPAEIRATLPWQFDVAWRLALFHLDGLTTAECLWRPAPKGPHVRQDADGRWRADWPEQQSYDLGPPSIAWITWHIGYWWSMVLDHSFGKGSLARENVRWPGSAEATRDWIQQLANEWLGHLKSGSLDLESAERTRWPFQGRPFRDVVAWANIELMKNAAELGYARFLYAVRSA